MSLKMEYFSGLKETGSIKARYRDLAKQYHPDLGGDKIIMQEINLQYEKVLQGYYQSAGKSISEIEELLASDEVLRRKIFEISVLNELIIEVCGCWLWITGNTKLHKDILKNCGFKWAHNKKAWYWRANENKCYFNRNKLTLDEIRTKHGSFGIDQNKFKRQAIA